ncbi:S-layer homology domain-containing protein [Feifania hominis]|nr:S-layer homology domain-containing protein [Feifania hominis]
MRKRAAAAMLAMALLLGAFSAAAGPAFASRITAADVPGAVEQLASSLGVRITDESGGALTVAHLRNFESAVDGYSAALFREMTDFYKKTYSLTFTVRYVADTGQEYDGLSELYPDKGVCRLSLVVGRGTDELTAAHEIAHFLTYPLLANSTALYGYPDPSDKALTAKLSPYNNGLLYEHNYYLSELGLSGSYELGAGDLIPKSVRDSWLSYQDEVWRRFGADQIFWDRYAQTNVIEDIATILGEVVANPVSSRTRLLSSTALRGKFDTIRELIGGLFASASKADVFTLLEREETPDAWAQPEVKKAIERGLFPEQMRHDYTEPISRADFCALLVPLFEKSLGKDLETHCKTLGLRLDKSPFADTDDLAVRMMAALGVVDGRGNGVFDPSGAITRQEAAKMLRQAASFLGAKSPTGTSRTYHDTGRFASWARVPIDYVTRAGIMNGISEDSFGPTETYSRQQAVVTVNRLFDYLLR